MKAECKKCHKVIEINTVSEMRNKKCDCGGSYRRLFDENNLPHISDDIHSYDPEFVSIIEMMRHSKTPSGKDKIFY